MSKVILSKPGAKVVILGSAGHGKDHIASIISKKFGLKFSSSTEFVYKKAIQPSIPELDGVPYLEARLTMNRLRWRHAISKYNNPPTKLAEELFENYDIYVGIREMREMLACLDADLFNLIIWVDASKRIVERDLSMEITFPELHLYRNRGCPILYIDNNGPITTEFQNLKTRIYKP